jgi:hypothetical protein
VRLGLGRSAMTRSSSGVAIYDFEGRTNFRLLQETPVCWVDLVDRTAYAHNCGAGVAVIDIPTGRVGHVRPGRQMQLITGDMTSRGSTFRQTRKQGGLTEPSCYGTM